MYKKLIVTFIGYFLLLCSQNTYCWTEENDDNDTSSEVYYYSNDTDRHNDEFQYNNYNNNYAHVEPRHEHYRKPHETSEYYEYSSRLPKQIAENERTIVIDPRVHAWGAYNAEGKLIRSGLATAGAKWCDDIGRPCRTKTGVFRILSLGDRDCISNKFPVDEGGAPMPYCMYFNGGQALHGSHELAEANISHGCVRISIQDAQWLRFDFANIGTKVIVKSY